LDQLVGDHSNNPLITSGAVWRNRKMELHRGSLVTALRRRFQSPWKVMSALGLHYRFLAEGNNMAFDYRQDRVRFRAAAPRAALLRAAGGNPRMIF
jgi:hypothetical protein